LTRSNVKSPASPPNSARHLLLSRLRELRRLQQAKAGRGATAPLDERVPDPADRAALTDPVTLAAHLDPTYQVRAHLRVIGQEMADLNAGTHWAQPGDRRLAIHLPPQSGKSRSSVEWGVFWWLCHHPTHRVVIGSYGDDLAVKRGRAIRRLVDTYGPRFGLGLMPGAASVKDWELVTGGGVRSVGAGSGITGHSGDLIVLDDPVKSRDEADSIRARDALGDWYSADLFSRRSPTCAILFVATPWHPDDLRARVEATEGRLEDGGKWRVLSMPALCTHPDRDPIGRRLGDPLPHPGVAEDDRAGLLHHWETIRAAVAARDWGALWQCDPQPAEGALLSWAVLRERRCYQHDSPSAPCAAAQVVAVAVDPSGGGRDTAGVVGGYLGVDGRLYLTHDRSGVMPSDQWGRVVCELAADTNADRVIIEANYGGDQALLVVRTAWEALRREHPDRFGVISPRVVAVHARRAKLLRAEPIAQQWIEDRVRTAAYLPELESEWVTWQPSADSPGRIDASVHLAYGLLPVPQSGQPSAAGAAPLLNTNLLPWGQSGGGGR
jgi:hypothetical protein